MSEERSKRDAAIQTANQQHADMTDAQRKAWYESERDLLMRWQEAPTTDNPIDILCAGHFQGFLAGYAAASRWMSIAENGLPSEKGEYLWKWKGEDEYLLHKFSVPPKAVDVVYFQGKFSHYQKIDPPKENK